MSLRPSNIRYSTGYWAIYPVYGRICCQISCIRLDIWPDIPYTAGYFVRYSVSGRIFSHISCTRSNILSDILHPAGYLTMDNLYTAVYFVSNPVSGRILYPVHGQIVCQIYCIWPDIWCPVFGWISNFASGIVRLSGLAIRYPAKLISDPSLIRAARHS